MSSKERRKVRLNGFALIFIFSVAIFLVSMGSLAWAKSTYIELAPDNLENVVAFAINNSGDVAGWGFDYDAGLHRGFLYHDDGTYTILLPDDPVVWVDAWGMGINNSGDVVGLGQYIGQLSGFLYSDGDYTEIRPLGSTAAEAYDINDNGDVVGNGYSYPSPGRNSGFLCTPPYGPGDYIPLSPPDWVEAYATAINNDGDVVGWGYDENNDKRAFLYTSASYSVLLPPGWYSAEAWGINDAGEVVGFGNDGSSYIKGFIYSGGTYTVMEKNPWDHLKAFDINNMGDVVGYMERNTSKPEGYDIVRAFVSEPKSNPHAKRKYTDVLPKGWVRSEAYGVNDHGDVVGTGYKTPGGNFFGFIATP
jgi:probable HAF family extracellular repeat protein